jgi:hypothetical protein
MAYKSFKKKKIVLFDKKKIKICHFNTVWLKINEGNGF